MAVNFDSVSIDAELNGLWTSLSSDVLIGDITARWGIFGYGHKDIISDTGQLRFALLNDSAAYYPDGGSPLAGWNTGTKVRLVFTYAGIPYIRSLCYLTKDSIKLNVSKSSRTSKADITALDWMDYAINTPVISPPTQEDVTADEVLDVLLNYVPVPVSLSADTGDYTFPAAFDNIGQNATPYSEFAKLMYSESPGYLYLQKPRNSGQLLVFENSTHRDSPTQKSTATLTLCYWLNQSGDYWLNQNGDYWVKNDADESDSAVVTFIASDLDAVALDYGGNVVNYATVKANPRRIDTEARILYQLPYPIPLANGQEISFDARYVDPDGGGTRVNAIVNSMLSPEMPGGTDETLMVLLNFSSDPIVDETGRHAVTQNDVTQTNAVYEDGFGTTMISSGILGGYGIFGGYADYNLSMPSSADFDLGGPTDKWTIGFHLCLLNPAAGNNVITRDSASNFPPYLLGRPNGADSDLGIFMSSNGSSFDIASDKSWGQVAVNRWVYYELCHDNNGWFYAFADGELTDKWYSALTFPTSSGTFNIGFTQGANYGYFGLDTFFIRKGVCLHRTNFEPPRRKINATLDGDFLLNTNEDGTGTDLSDGLTVQVKYYPDIIRYTIRNQSGSAGSLIHLQARGRGIYLYDPIEKIAQNTDSIKAHNYQTISINQAYQQDLDAGTTWITNIVANDKDPKTRLRGINFFANKSASNMLRFLQCDIGDLIRVTLSDPGIDDYFHIQNIGLRVFPGNLVYVSFGLIPGNTP